MQKRTLRFLSIILCGVIALGLSACSAGSLKYIKIPAPSLQGNLLQEELQQKIAVLLPPDYAPDAAPYPVLYFLPGFAAPHKHVARNLAKATRAQSEQGRRMILVVVNGTSKLGGCFYTNSPVTGNWEDYVTQDIVSYIDDNYNTNPTAAARGIAGHSMGGYGALTLAMKHPQLFGHVYSMSAGLFDENGVEHAGVNFPLLQSGAKKYGGLAEKNALRTYVKDIKKLPWPDNFSYAYASAFAYDAEAAFPYIQVPALNGGGKAVSGEIYARYAQGFGGWSLKTTQYRDNLLALENIAIEYGEQDALTWIPKGARHVCALLREQQIPHKELPFEGGHVDRLNERFSDVMLPFFAEAFAAKAT